MPALDGLTGIVLAAIFGSVFVITCIISTIKAVRDRSRIKRRRAVRRKEIGNADEKNKSFTPTALPISQRCTPSCSGSYRLSNGATCLDGSLEHLDLSIYSISGGLDNLTFQHSDTNIECNDENFCMSSQNSEKSAEIVPSIQQHVPTRVKSHEANNYRKRNMDNLSADCVDIKKVKRRHSYEIAVSNHSCFSCSSPTHAILDVCISHENTKNNSESFKVAFENKAFDNDDNKKT